MRGCPPLPTPRRWPRTSDAPRRPLCSARPAPPRSRFLLGLFLFFWHRDGHGVLDQEVEGLLARDLLLAAARRCRSRAWSPRSPPGSGRTLRRGARSRASTSSSSASIPSAATTASSASSFLTVSSASGLTRSSKSSWLRAGELVVLLGLHALRPDAPLEALDHLVRLLVDHDVRAPRPRTARRRRRARGPGTRRPRAAPRPPVSCSRTAPRSSSSVSNSLASLANSSSSGGRSRSLISLTCTLKSTDWPRSDSSA